MATRSQENLIPPDYFQLVLQDGIVRTTKDNNIDISAHSYMNEHCVIIIRENNMTDLITACLYVNEVFTMW